MTNTQDTSSAVVADAVAGAGALAPAPEVLTIQRGGLAETWLPAEKKEARTRDYLWSAAMRACATKGKKGYDELIHAYCAVEREWMDTVREIVKRGGLLHIGARA